MATSSPKKNTSKEILFSWEGKDRQGAKQSGQVRATSESAAQSMLRRKGVQVSKLKRTKLKGGKKITEKDIALFTRQLATMMKAGVPMIQSFDIAAKGHANPSVTRLLNDIRSDIEVGNTMNSAFRKYPNYFDPLFCNLVTAGEQAGILDDLLDRLSVYKEKMLALRGKIKSALFYPIAVVIVAIVVTFVIMIFVVPAFKEIFSSFGAQLPAPTLIVIAMSDFVVKWWWLMFGIIGGGLYFFFQSWKRSKVMQDKMDFLLLKIPVFGELVEKASIARWSSTLSTMFAAGVPLIEALDSVGGASGNAKFRNATKRIQDDISTGTSLATSMQDTGVFPNMVIQMTQIGEESGALESMLAKVAEIYEREVDEMADALSSLMEPIIMSVLGVLIGGLIVAMYLPIFKLGSVVG